MQIETSAIDSVYASQHFDDEVRTWAVVLNGRMTKELNIVDNWGKTLSRLR